PMDLNTLSPSVFPDFKKIIERSTAVRSKRYTQAQQMLADIQAIGSKIIAPTIQSVAQAGEERILLAVTDITWGMLEPHFSSMKLASMRSEEHTSELQSRGHLVCRLLLEKKKKNQH